MLRYFFVFIHFIWTFNMSFHLKGNDDLEVLHKILRDWLLQYAHALIRWLLTRRNICPPITCLWGDALQPPLDLLSIFTWLLSLDFIQILASWCLPSLEVLSLIWNKFDVLHNIESSVSLMNPFSKHPTCICNYLTIWPL